MIALGADHGGYRLKEAIKKSLDAGKIAYRDFGTFSEESVDYPPIAAEVARFVAAGHAEKGILCCGTGIGMSIAANKITGIRAAVCTNAFCAEVTRRHNDANILCLGGRVISENDAVEFARLFLSTPFDGGRHLKRVNEIAAIERGGLEASINAMEGKKMENQVVVMQHPLIQHKLAYLRDTNTGSKEFRQLVSEIATLLCYEATRDLPLEEKLVETPCGTAKAKVISGRKLAFVPILRAGLGMVDGVLSLVPAAKVGHIGLYRDPKTLKPVEYYSKLPHDIEQRDVIVLDPMLATGGSSSDAVTIIKRSHPKSIKFMCIIAAPEGIKVFTETHPDVQLYCAAVDDHLNEHGYIVPGLGDAGDRIFGTL